MVWMFLLATLLLGLVEVMTVVVARRRIERVLAHLKTAHPERYAERFQQVGVGDRVMGVFLNSPEDFGDAELARLKRSAIWAREMGMKPLLIFIGLMLAVMMFSNILALVRRAMQ